MIFLILCLLEPPKIYGEERKIGVIYIKRNCIKACKGTTYLSKNFSITLTQKYNSSSLSCLS